MVPASPPLFGKGAGGGFSQRSRPPALFLVPYLFFSPVFLMVASGFAACFMKAEGLMPTMFLNCLEKW